MHIHILGICGTFMGGLAALAREAGHRVTGCDANVYPPMSDQLRALGIELIEGFGAEQLALEPDVFVVGNVVTRGNALMEAILDAGAALHQRPAVAGRARAAGPPCAGRGRHARQDHHHLDAGLDAGAGRPAAGLPGGRRAAELRRLGAAGPAGKHLRHRGRRVRHRLLRQAQQVRALPAAHRDPEQPRVRPRRHLPRPGRDRDAVPPPGAHRAGAAAGWW